MEYKVELKPFVKKDGVKYKIIRLTDIKLHTTAMQPSSVGKAIKKSIESGQHGRIFTPIEKHQAPNNEYKLNILNIAKNDPVLQKTVQDYEKQGYKVLIEIPVEPLPMLVAEDTIEFMVSTKGQRILRRLAKENPKN